MSYLQTELGEIFARELLKRSQKSGRNLTLADFELVGLSGDFIAKVALTLDNGERFEIDIKSDVIIEYLAAQAAAHAVAAPDPSKAH